ncbi:MAG: hypothetical protein ACTSU5_13090 [Promethearchaeota archaeon]
MALFHKKDSDSIKCPKCGYQIIQPFPQFCPKCQTSLRFELEAYDRTHGGELKRKKILEKTRKIVAKPVDVSRVKEMKPTAATASKKIKGVRVKVRKKVEIDLSKPFVELVPNQEYIKLAGIIHEDRIPIYCSNLRYEYFLELSCNLDDIATSILGGDLDRMYLVANDGASDTCFFSVQNGLIYILLGQFHLKKANWLLSQMKIHLNDILGNRVPRELEKIDIHNIQRKFDGVLTSLLTQYRKLGEVMSDREIESVVDTVRVDYFGMSYRSIGVISKLYGDELPIQSTGADGDATAERELKESLLTAKLEAIAANTLANTNCIPRWISVKLGFESFRWMVFGRLPNEYFYQILAEGNINRLLEIEPDVKAIVNRETDKPFTGDLSRFEPVLAQLNAFFEQRVFKGKKDN